MSFMKWVKRAKGQVMDLLSGRSLNLALGFSLLLPYLSNFIRKDEEQLELVESPAQNDSSERFVYDVSAAVGADFKPIGLEFEQSSLNDLLGNLPHNVPLKHTLDESVFLPSSTHLNLTLFEFEFEFELEGVSLTAFDKSLVQYWAIENYQVYTLGYTVDEPAGMCYSDDDEPLILWDLTSYLLGGLAALLGGYSIHRMTDADTLGDVTNPAIISGDITGGVIEDTQSPVLTQSGQLVVIDEDVGESLFQTDGVTVSAGALGVLEITADGAWSYEVNNADIQYLAEGVTKDEIFTVLSSDGTEQDIIMTITGVNDAPTVTAMISEITESDSSYGMNLLSASDAQDVDGDTVVFVENSAVQVDGTVDVGGFLIDPKTGDVLINPSHYSYLHEGESLEVSYSFKVSDGVEETTNTATFTILGVEPPEVEIFIDQPIIDDVAMLSVGHFDVNFDFSEEVTDFSIDDINVSLGNVVSGSLRVDEIDNSLWHAEVIVTEDDFSTWVESDLATISVDSNRFVDLTGNSNLVGDDAYYRVFAEDQYSLVEDVIIVDNFVHPSMLSPENLEQPNLVLGGTALDDFIDGYTGDDILYGFSGDDVMVGYTGDDTLLGGDGDDVLIGRDGDDFSFGGEGSDAYYADILGPELNTQDIFIGGNGFDIAYFSLDSEQYSVSVMSSVQKSLINEMLTNVYVSDAQLREVYSELENRVGADETAFVKILIDEFTIDQHLTKSNILDIESEFGQEVSDVLWDLPGFREIAIGNLDSFDEQQQVIQVTYTEPQTDGTVTEGAIHTTFVQAEALMFNSPSINVVAPSEISTWTGTDKDDLFLIDNLSSLEDEFVAEIWAFEVGADTVDISGIYTSNEDDSINQDTDINTILSSFELQLDGSAEIDLSDFVDDNGASLNGIVKINFSEEVNTISADSFVNHSELLQINRWEEELLAANLNT